MENASVVPTDVWNDVTATSSSKDVDALKLHLAYVRDLVLEVIYIVMGTVVMGTVGVVDNLFVIVTFALFIKITDKVFVSLMSILMFVTLQECF